MAYYNCSLMSDSEIQKRYPNLLKEGYTSADIRTEITAWQDKQRKTLGESYKYDSVPLEKEIYNRIEEKELAYYNSPAYEKELQDILDKAPRDKEGHLLAPNGKPTNLTEKQYAQVRTKSFKKWFGDWETLAEGHNKKLNLPDKPSGLTDTWIKDNIVGFKGLSTGTKYNISYSGGRYFIVININGINVPFYKSSGLGGKKNVEAGKWYPFFGISKKGWLNKTTEDEINNYYDSQVLKLISNKLDSLFNNEDYGIEIVNGIPVKKGKQANNAIDLNFTDGEKVINKDLTPTENHKDNTVNIVNSNIEKVKRSISYTTLNNKVSKVVDENGEPLVVYHYTDNENLTAFSTDFDNYFSKTGGTKKAIFFTEDNVEVGSEDNFLTSRKKKLPLFLNIRNLEEHIGTKEDLHKQGTSYREIVNKSAKREDNTSGLVFKGFDDNKKENQTIYVVHSSNQIKSATDNRGTFSTEDDNIYKHLLHKDIISEKDYIEFLEEFELSREKTDDFLYNFITKILQVNPRNKRDKSIPLTVQNYPTSNKVFIDYRTESTLINRILGLSANFSFDSETFEKDLKDYIENKWEKDLYEELIRLDKELLSNLNRLYEEKTKVQNNISLLQVYLNRREQSPKEVLEYVESFKSTKRKTTSLAQHIGYELRKKKSELAILDEKIKHYRFSNASKTLKVKNRLAALYNIDNVKELVFNRIKADRDSYKLPKEEWEKKIAPYMSLYEKAKKASKNAELLEYNNPIFENKKSLDEISVNELYNKLIQLNPKMKSLLEFIKTVNPKLKIKVYNTEDYNNLAEREDSYISGQSASIFFPRKNEIAFRLNADTPTILHELLHSVSSYGLIGSSEDQKALGKNVIQPFIDYIDNYLKQNVGNFGSYSIFGAKMPATIYGLTNPAEFIAELFSNKDFQELLDAIPPMEKKQYSSLLEEIIDSILNFVKNIFAPKTNETALDQAIQLSLAVIRTQYENIDEIYEQLSNIKDTAQKQILDKQEAKQIPVYQTPTLDEDTKVAAAFPSASIRRDRVNLIKRLIQKGLSKEYERQLAELEQRARDIDKIEDLKERQKVHDELVDAHRNLTEDKAKELGVGQVIKAVKEVLSPEHSANSKEAERARLMRIEGFKNLSPEKQEQIVENNYQKKNKAYRIIQDNWNSLIDEVLPIIYEEDGLKIDRSSEPDIDEEAGRDMYQVKARNEDMRSSLSKEIKKLISNVRWIRPDGKFLKDDLGFAKYLNSDYVHISLLESLSKARSCMDFWNIFENLALRKPWVNELKKELDKNESLKSKFYQDFRKEFIPYWIEYEYETNKKTGQRKRVTKRVNKTAFLYNTLDSWKDNLEGGTILNDFHIFNEDGSVNNDNIEKVLKVVTDLTSKYQEAHNNSLTSGRQEVIDFISNNLPRIKTVIESLGLEVDSDSLNETLNEKDANISEILSVTSEMLNKLKEGILDGKDINNNPIQLDFFDTLGGYATRLAKAINTIDKDSVLKSFRESGKSYQSYTVPSYFGKVLENLKNGNAEDIRQYLMNNYGKYEWFYDHNTNQWRNEWLKAFYENPDKYKNIIERKVVLHSDKKDFNDWGDKQYALSMLTEFGLEDKSKKTAYYYLPVLADAESAEFIQFERFIGSDDKFKSDIRKKLSNVVWQEYYRIQLVKQRKKEGATPIDNFDKRGEKFCFIPELNTLRDDNGNLFIDSLINKINSGDKLAADALIDYALDKILTDGFTDFYNKLNETGVLTQTKDNKNVFFGYSAEDMNNALVNFYYNNALAQTQIIELLTTDLAYYKSLNDFQKRFKEVYVMNRKLNTTSKHGRKFEKTVILKDLKIKAPSYDTIEEILDKAVEDKRISSSIRDRILGLYADEKVNVADAQAFRSLSSYKAVLDMAGRWTDKMDRALERMKNGSFSDEDFETIFQTIKPFVYTQTTKSTGVENTKDFGEYLKTPMQCKNSEFLLINALNTMVFALSNSGKLKAIEQFMEDYNVDVVQFESAVKCGGQGKLDLSTLSDSDYNGVYDYLKKTTGFNVDSENGNSDYVTIIDYEDYGIQTENPEHLLDTQALFGTQIRKLIFEDMPNGTKFTIGNKEFTKEKLWDLYNKLLSSNVFLSYKEIEKEFGSIEGIAKLVQKQVKENPLMYSEELRKACELVEVTDEKTGETHKEFNLPIYDPVQRNRIEALLLSVIKNTVVKQKIKGASCVQVSCFGTTDSLHIERTEDGGIKYIECYLPAYSKQFFQPFFKKDKDGKPYLDINELPEDLRKCIGYRIPTEGHYSMQPLYIKGFLPVQNGSMIMLPAEITQLTGSDFKQYWSL